MIKSFKHKGLEKFFCNADACGIQTQMAARIDRMLDAIDQAQDVNELALPGWYLHPLKGDKKTSLQHACFRQLAYHLRV